MGESGRYEFQQDSGGEFRYATVKLGTPAPVKVFVTLL
jgi:hypothetical protein